MQRTSILVKNLVSTMAVLCICLVKAAESSDDLSSDEKAKPPKYESVAAEDICRASGNPKCEEIIDDFCDPKKGCNKERCGSSGSTRGICRLICEPEALPPECLKMGPTKVEAKKEEGQPDASEDKSEESESPQQEPQSQPQQMGGMPQQQMMMTPEQQQAMLRQQQMLAQQQMMRQQQMQQPQPMMPQQ